MTDLHSLLNHPKTDNDSHIYSDLSAGVSEPSSPKLEAKLSRVFECDKCHLKFTRLTNLKSHHTTHTSVRPFQCALCHHQFRRQHDLRRHERLHTGEKPHKCETCHRSFARMDALNRHRRVETACHNHPYKKKPHSSPPASIPLAAPVNSTKPSSASLEQPFTNHRPPIPQLQIPVSAMSLSPPNNFLASSSNLRQLEASQQRVSLPWCPTSRTLPHPIPSPPSSVSSQPTSSPLLSSIHNSAPLLLTPIPQHHAKQDSLFPPTSFHNLPSPHSPNMQDQSDNDSLRKQLETLQQQNQDQQAQIHQLKESCHDLSVENKVLKSLVLGKEGEPKTLSSD
ncbi:hypothetical protein DM01DRAFT_1337276 [Hesseltinella vesiculosa]|uniref:C2H2-type domain-containing protein n=1 Tax=Hesseltinella vesiculosa TaxID=101127 RepID=A0A1X2GDB4_9FUNG|nr:hypothetical protein DM01DRAFT_1337276 [Hesseltinella vesiculosa]